MGNPPPPNGHLPARTLTDLNPDTLAHCAGFLGPRDLASMALTSKALRSAAYSDSVWRRLFCEKWPYLSASSEASGVRDEYLARRTALLQLKFDDPSVVFISSEPIPHSHILLNKNDLFLAQGSSIGHLKIGSRTATETLRAHSARITCMRLVSLADTSLFRSEMQSDDNVLVTASSDRSIRLWWKGHSQRCFRGHNGPVITLADRLLGDCGSKVLASGGEDCTVRLWSVRSTGKHHPLTVTYFGHEKPVSLLSVAGHKPSLLVSVSIDSRVRVWDTLSSSSSTSSSCVGMARLCGPPVGMKCHDSQCYISAGSSVVAMDLRTMQKVATVAAHPKRIHSFEFLPSKWLICTGGEEKAKLWDIRRNSKWPEPVADLEVQNHPVTMLHMDPYKIVTGGPFDRSVNVWETDTGSLANTLDCRVPGEPDILALSAMAVDGCRIVTSGCAEVTGIVHFRDYSNCVLPSSSNKSNIGSKFWEPQGAPSDCCED